MKRRFSFSILLFSCLPFAALGQQAVPFECNFDTQEEFNQFTVIDANNDGCTWSWCESVNSFAWTKFSSHAMNDWLVTPGIKVSAGKHYVFSFVARAATSSFPERMEVKYGNAATADALTETLVDKTDLTSSDYHRYTREIEAKEDGTLFFGIHSISDANMLRMYVDSVSVTAGTETTSPDSVSSLSVKAAGDGALQARISFVAPAKSIDGGTLQSIDSAVISRNGSEIATVKDIAPGKEVVYTDESVPSSGYYTYEVAACNASGKGLSAGRRLWVGLDTPKAPQDVALTENGSNFVVEWESVPEFGIHGGPVNASNVVYDVWKLNDTDTISVGSVQAAGKFEAENATDAATQTLQRFFVSAKNAEGESAKSASNYLVTGNPYTLPFYETFPGAKPSHFFWTEWDHVYGSTHFDYWTAGDGDDGSAAYWVYYGKASSSLCSGRIALGKVEHPAIIYRYECKGGINEQLHIVLQDPLGVQDTIQTINFLDLPAGQEWHTGKVSVPLQYTNDDYVLVKFCVDADIPNDYAGVHIDNIRVENISGNDIAVSAAGPVVLAKGRTGNITVRVANNGDNDVDSYQLRLLEGGKVYAEKTVDEPLKSYASADVTMDYRPNVMSGADSTELVVEAAIEGLDDERPSDNSTELKVKFSNPELSTVSNLTATASDDNGTVLNWTAPEVSTQRVTEDFESYEPWVPDTIGNWTSRDGDKANVYGLYGGFKYPHSNDPWGFMVFNPSKADDAGTATEAQVGAHSGSQYAAAVYSRDPWKTTYADQDNWLISPELPGVEQEISLWAASRKNYNETFDILYSTTDTALASFTKIGDTHKLTTGGWENVTSQLPEGARFFAIHHNTIADDAYLFRVDDIAYTAFGAGVKAYNVYVDGSLYTTVEATQATVSSGSGHEYAVTVVYEDGSESLPVSVSTPTGVSSLRLGNNVIGIYTLDGIQISTMQRGVNIIKLSDGSIRKVIVK